MSLEIQGKSRLKKYFIRGIVAVSAIGGVGIASLAGYVSYTWDRTWDAPLPDIHASTDPAVIRRGEYLVFGPAHCSECHTSPTEDAEFGVEQSEHPRSWADDGWRRRRSVRSTRRT
jgi:mono/diheme cytochrome c family protein